MESYDSHGEEVGVDTRSTIVEFHRLIWYDENEETYIFNGNKEIAGLFSDTDTALQDRISLRDEANIQINNEKDMENPIMSELVLSDIVCRIDWTREDIAAVLEEAGRTVTEEEIDQFVKKFNWRYFEEKTISDGYEMLASDL